MRSAIQTIDKLGNDNCGTQKKVVDIIREKAVDDPYTAGLRYAKSASASE